MTRCTRIPRQALRVLFIAFAGLGALGCALTYDNVQRATRPHYEFARLVSIDRASESQGRVYVWVTVQQPDDAQAELILKIDAQDRRWILDEEVAPPLFVDKVVLAHVTNTHIVRAEDVPASATPLPVELLAVENLGKVGEAARAQGPGLHVFSVMPTSKPTYGGNERDIYEKQEAPAGPLLAVVLSENDKEPIVCGVADVQHSVKRHRGWFALVPLTVAGDIVTAPFQVIGLLLGGGC